MRVCTCNANSRVGHTINPLTPTTFECAANLLIIGNKKAAVFPLPVLEQATISLPSKASGITYKNKILS